MKNGEDDCYGANLGSLECPDASALKGKIKQKPPEVEEAREGKPHNRVKRAPPRPWGSPRSDRGCHHGPWCPLVLVARFCCSAAFWCPSVLCLGPRVFAFLGVFWASLQASFDPHGPHFTSLDSS